MQNRILSLLLTLCLAVCLPINANAATVSASVTLAGHTLSVKAHNSPAYFTNAKDTHPNAENWNAKLIWNSGEDLPTLHLKGFAVNDAKQTGIGIPAGQPMRIVIAADSQINAQFGIIYKSDLEIVSEGDAKLTIHCRSSAITSEIATGCKLTIDANLDLLVEAYYDASSHILQTNKADLTINGGNIKVSTDDEQSLFGIVTRHSGNIIINGGNLDVNSSIGAAPANGSIHASDKLIINGGTVKATAKASTPLYAKKGIEISGGLVEINAPNYGINAGTPDFPADVAIKGGTVKITAQRAFFTYPILGEGVFAYAGADETSAQTYDGTLTALAKEPWMLISNDPNLQKESEPSQVPSSTIPTELTTEASTSAPTSAPTTAPTEFPSSAPSEPPSTMPTETTDTKTPAISPNAPLLLWLATVCVMALLGILITLIAFPRKKP